MTRVNVTVDTAALQRMMSHGDGHRFLERLGDEIKQKASDNTPVGATGNLRDSVELDTRPGKVVISADAGYAEAVHGGTKGPYKNVPPYGEGSSLHAWAGKKGRGAVFVLARSIAKNGTKANPFLVKALNTVLSRYPGYTPIEEPQ